MQKIIATFFFLLSLSILLNPAYSITLTGQVVSVADGDAISIFPGDSPVVRIRLYGIDCPEGGQAFGMKAKKFTSSLVFNKEVEVKSYDTDRYGRTVGIVFVDGINVNEEIIKAGYAWQYKKYCKESFCSDWLKLERHARESKIGLWYDKNPDPPWEFRKQAKGKWRKKATRKRAATAGRFKGNVKSKVYHAPGCQHYDCKNCVEGFDTMDKAVSAGYRAHTQCVR